MEHLKRLHPDLPEPVEIKCHRWRYSQVSTAYHGPEPYLLDLSRSAEEVDRAAAAVDAAVAAEAAGRDSTLSGTSAAAVPSAVAAAASASSPAGAIAVFDRPPLLLAGDAFANSSFEGCLDSAAKVRGCAHVLCAVRERTVDCAAASLLLAQAAAVLKKLLLVAA